ncbi:MAG: murein biosynthesis integral membrane protein MurJ [Gordonia sp. (in: high G+C Gram-positive bacteria)]
MSDRRRHEELVGERSASGIETSDESSTELARDSDASILRTSGSIALATLTSRITGFVRTVLVLAMLGPAIASAFQAAYVLPNMIAEVVLGAVLTAIVIPVLVRAEAEDPDGGRGFINRIFTLSVLTLGGATIIALIAAPLLTYLNVGDGDVNRPLTTALAYLLLPEILFYGLSALFMAILNMRGFFKPGAWAPVLNNLVQIATLTLYAVMPGQITLNPVRMTDPQLLVLGIGTTLGVVIQVSILIPWLRRAGVAVQWKWGIDARLRRFGNMAVAIVTYVAILQVGLVITYRIAAHATASGISVYATHWQLLQLPYGVLGVTILTAIMPRLSRNAAADKTGAVIDDLSLATRLTMISLVPTVAFMTFFGPAIGIAVFNFGRFDANVAAQLGSVLAWGAFTLIPYSMTLVQLRVFYAREDAWTPTVMVLGITAVKVGASYLGPLLFTDPDLVVRWLALSNGLGYLVGAIVGHYLLRARLGNVALAQVTRTTLVSLGVSVGVASGVWLLAQVSGLHRLATGYGKLGSLTYLAMTAVVVLGTIYAGLAAAGLPDVVSIANSVRRMAGRFIPGLAPRGTDADTPPAATITVAFPRVTADESLPYSGQVQVIRRFDRGTATWQSYAVHSGGAAGTRNPNRPAQPQFPADIRYRRKGVGYVSDSAADPLVTTSPLGSSPRVGISPPLQQSGPSTDADSLRESTSVVDQFVSAEPRSASPATTSPATAVEGADLTAAPRPRGPRLVPGASVAGGRYRLLEHHGGTRGLQFWRAQDTNLDREVGLTFVDAEQLAPPLERDALVKTSDTGPQAVLTRTLRLGQITSSGIARVLDVVRGSSGGIVITEWVQGSSLAEVARSGPSPIGAARAVRALAAAAESAHRSGGALSIDHPDRIRISTEGNAVLAFPGTLAGDDKSSDVRGLGAVLYALLLARWPLDSQTGSRLVTTNDVTTSAATTSGTPATIGGLPVASPGPDGEPVEPREVRADIPFEISAVAARALDGSRGIRTAATVQHVLDQATVVDLKTDMLPVVDSYVPPVRIGATDSDRESPSAGRRNLALLAGAALLAVFVVTALVVWISGAFGGGNNTDIDSILTTNSAPSSARQNSAGQKSAAASRAATAVHGPIGLRSVAVVDVSSQPADSSENVANVISGASPAWHTDSYRASPAFGGLKNGLGLIFDLGGDTAVQTVTITTPTPGFTVELRTSPVATPTLARTSVVARGAVDSPTTSFTIAHPQKSPYLMVWITSLPTSSPGSFQAQIARVTMTS